LKRKISLTLLAAVAAVLMPLLATAQVAPDADQVAPLKPVAAQKYSVFAGFAYTSLNQVNLSRYGLMGVRVDATRNWGKYFGITATGGYYKYATSQGNPGSPLVYSILAGPELHANLYGNLSGLFHGLIGIEHTGGEHMTPNISFAGGVGVGMDYKLSQHLSVRAVGDRIGTRAPHWAWSTASNRSHSPSETQQRLTLVQKTAFFVN